MIRAQPLSRLRFADMRFLHGRRALVARSTGIRFAVAGAGRRRTRVVGRLGRRSPKWLEHSDLRLCGMMLEDDDRRRPGAAD
jgi:hypothetical protein